jgi:hypothetical protein
MNMFDRVLKAAEEQPLSKILPAALRLANSADDEALASWIRLELMGYVPGNPTMRDDTVVPEYRGVGGQWFNEYGRRLVIEDPDLGFINEVRLRQGVAELEGIASATSMLVIQPTEFSELLRRELHVEVSIFRYHPSAINQVLTNIRTRVLDRLAASREKLSAVKDAEVLQEPEVFQLKPSLYGVTVDLKALWQRLWSKKNDSPS